MWRGYGFQLVDRATVVSVNKNPQKLVEQCWTQSQSFGGRGTTSACQSLICVRCPCARARVLSRFLGTSGIFLYLSPSLLVVSCVSCFSAVVEIKNTHRFNLRYHPTRFVRPYCDEILAGMKCWYGGSLAICYLPAGWQQTFLWLRYTTSANTNWRSL